MKDEKLMILKMLEEGKISSEEAIELIEAIEDKKDAYEEERARSVTDQIFDALGELGNDMGNLLSKSIDEIKDFGSNFNIGGNYEVIRNDLDLDISHISSPDLSFKAVNGSIRLQKTDGDKILIHSKCETKRNGIDHNEVYYEFYEENNKVIFEPKYRTNISIHLDILVPDKYYNSIVLETSNGKILVENINGNDLAINTSNSSIDIFNSKFEDIVGNTKNGRIELRDIVAYNIDLNTSNSSVLLMMIKCNIINAHTKNAKIIVNDLDSNLSRLKTSNGSISLDGSMLEEVYLSTTNGRIHVREVDIEKLKLIDLSTTNGGIDCKIYNNNFSYLFDLETSSGHIDLDVPHLVYEINKIPSSGPKKIVASSPDFSEGIRVKASTTNSSIKVY